MMTKTTLLAKAREGIRAVGFTTNLALAQVLGPVAVPIVGFAAGNVVEAAPKAFENTGLSGTVVVGVVKQSYGFSGVGELYGE
jgi:hypothetical protein